MGSCGDGKGGRGSTKDHKWDWNNRTSDGKPRRQNFNMEPVANLWEIFNSGVTWPLWVFKDGKKLDGNEAAGWELEEIQRAWTHEWHEDEEMRKGKTLGQRSGLGGQWMGRRTEGCCPFKQEAPSIPQSFQGFLPPSVSSLLERILHWELLPDNTNNSSSSYHALFFFIASRTTERQLFVYFLSLPGEFELHEGGCCLLSSWLYSRTQNRAGT